MTIHEILQPFKRSWLFSIDHFPKSKPKPSDDGGVRGSLFPTLLTTSRSVSLFKHFNFSFHHQWGRNVFLIKYKRTFQVPLFSSSLYFPLILAIYPTKRTRVGIWPSWRWIIGPSFWKRWKKVWWGMSVRRWRWPIIGRDGGDGGVSRGRRHML